MATLTKEEILVEFSRLPESELRDLYTVSESIIKPFRVDIVDGTFASTIEFINEQADLYFPDWTDRSQNDFGMFLCELFAMFSDINSWTINALFLESHLTSARNLESLQALSRVLGHVPRQLSAARTVCDLTVETAPDAYQYVDFGTVKVSDGGDTLFSNLDKFEVDPNATYPLTIPNIAFTQAERIQQTTKFNGRPILTDNESVIPTSVQVFVNGEEFEWVKTFANSGETDKHYTYQVRNNGRLMILFGGVDNKGLIPDIDSDVLIVYYYGGGSQGNFFAVGSIIKIIEQPTGLGLTAVTNITESSEGADLETADELRVLGNSQLGGTKICYDEDNTERVVNLVSGVQKSKAVNLNGLIDIYVMPFGGTPSIPPSQDLLDSVRKFVAQRLPFDFALKNVTGVEYYPLTTANGENLDIKVWLRDDVSRSRIETEILDRIDTILSAAGQSTSIKKGFLRSEVIDALLGKDGIDGVVNVNMDNPTSDIAIENNQIITEIGSDISLTMYGGIDNNELDYLDRQVIER